MSAGPAERGDTIRRNTALALVTEIVTATFTAGVTVFLVRALGPESFGEFSLAMAIGLVLLQPSDFGLSHSAARFIAEHRGDRGAVTAVLADALRLKLLSAVAVSAAMLALAGPVASAYGQPGLEWPLRGMALALFGQSLMFFWGNAFISLRRVGLNLRVVLSESTVEAGATVGLVLLGGGAAGAAFGRAIGYGFGALFAALLLYRLFGRPALAALSGGGHLRRVARYAGALLVIDTAWSATGQVSALVLGGLLGATAVGIYQAPNRLTTVLSYPGLAVANGVAPHLSRAGPGPNVDAFRTALRYMLVLQAWIVVPLVAWADPLTFRLLGGEYRESAEVLRALSPYVLAFGIAPLVSLAVNYLGEARRRVPIAIGALLANVVVSLVLIPEVGVVGAAVGADVSLLLYSGGHLWICKRLLDLPLRPVAATLARTSIAGAAMAAVLVAFGTGATIPVGAILGGGIAGSIAFAGVLLATGEITRAELGAARRELGRRLGRA